MNNLLTCAAQVMPTENHLSVSRKLRGPEGRNAILVARVVAAFPIVPALRAGEPGGVAKVRNQYVGCVECGW